MGKGLECAPRHPLRPSGFGEAAPFLDFGGEGSGVGVGVGPCAARRPAPCVPSRSAFHLAHLAEELVAGPQGAFPGSCFSATSFPGLGKGEGMGGGRSDHFAPRPAPLSTELPSLPSPFGPRSWWDGARMIEKLDRVALSTSLSSANLFRDWPFKALFWFVRKGILPPPPPKPETFKGYLKGRKA